MRQTLALVLLLLLRCVLCQREDYELQKWQENKFWWWSSSKPMTIALDELPDVVRGTEMILRHFERIEQKIIERIGSRVPPNGNDILQPCISPDQIDWPRAVNSNFGARGFPSPDLSCITDHVGVKVTLDDQPPYTADELYEAALNRGLEIERNAKSVASTFIDTKKNYTAPDFVFNYPYNTTTLNCVLHPVHGVRSEGRWRLGTGIHNRPKSESLPLLARKNIVEYHRVVDGHLGDNLLMRLPERPKGDGERTIHEDATTLIVNARGHANPSMYRFIPIPENPAILESLDSANVFIQQAEDAVAPSNLAILILPLALNIVPVTLFAQVSTIKMLLYLILTDMLTVIPLLIKGIELIQIQGKTYRAVVLRVSSSFNSTPAEAAAAEMWASECQARENIRHIGIGFVVLAVVFLVGGVILELVARHYLMKRNRRFKLAWLRGSPSEFSSSGKLTDDMEWTMLGAKGEFLELYADDTDEAGMYTGGVFIQQRGSEAK